MVSDAEALRSQLEDRNGCSGPLSELRDNWSLTHDVKIVLKTIFVVLTGGGAH